MKFQRYSKRKRRRVMPAVPATLPKVKALPVVNPAYPTFTNGGDRKSLFCQEFVLIGHHLALLGATNERMAEVFGVDKCTMERWLEREPEFADAIRRGREIADGEVAHSLYRKAVGYSHPDTHFSTAKKLNGDTEVIATPTVKYYPPDTTACIFWLKNRQRAHWRDVYRQEHTGADGQPIVKQVQLDLSRLTDEQLHMAESLGLQLVGDADVPSRSSKTGTRVKGNDLVN